MPQSARGCRRFPSLLAGTLRLLMLCSTLSTVAGRYYEFLYSSVDGDITPMFTTHSWCNVMLPPTSLHSFLYTIFFTPNHDHTANSSHSISFFLFVTP
jgi:hypothetical protein